MTDALAEIDQLYGNRDQHDAQQRMLALLETALQREPESYEVAWRASRHWQWIGDIARADEVKRDAGKKAWHFGELATSQNLERVEGHFYEAVGIGLYSQAVGIVKALTQGLESKFLTHIERAILLDPKFSGGGPRFAKGRYHYLLPWPKRDLARAQAYLEEALQTNPEALRSYLYLAEVQEKSGHKGTAKRTLEKVLSGDSSYDPPEAALIKAWARDLERRW